MKLGLLEIALIIFVVIAVIIIARIIRPGYIASRKDDRPSADISSNTSKQNADKRMTILTRTGIALISAGGIALVAGIIMLRWVIHNYVLSFVLIVCGVIILVLSRRKR
jgi:hypothetical protein